MKRLLLNLLWILPIAFMFQSFEPPKDGKYKIEINIDNYNENYVILAFYYADKPYIRDTIFAKKKGKFVYEGEDELKGGMYMIVMPPKNNSFDFFIDDEDKNFKIKTDYNDYINNMKFEGSKSNTAFYTYLQFLGGQREASKKIEPLLAACRQKKDEACIKKHEAELIAINDGVNKYQLNYIKTYPDYFSAKFIQTSMDVKVPKEIKQENQYRYYRNHFFDNLDLGDGRLIRTPLVPQKVDRYLDKIIPQHPDSVIAGVDVILNRSEKDEDMFKYMLIKLVNKYAQSKVVCMDAVYVHIVDNFYLNGKAAWIDKAQLDKMRDNADRLRPILCNKVAPDLKMQTIPKKEGDKPEVVSLHGIKSKFTVMIFWAPDCGHCKKSMPKIVEFYDNYKPKGVEIFSICTKTYKDYQNCVDFTREKDMIRMLNVTDPYLKSKFPVIYDIKSTPVIFLLDENKVILAKRLAAEQLGEVIDSWTKRYEQLEKDKEKGK